MLSVKQELCVGYYREVSRHCPEILVRSPPLLRPRGLSVETEQHHVIKNRNLHSNKTYITDITRVFSPVSLEVDFS